MADTQAICSLLTYIEQHVHERMAMEELERTIHFSRWSIRGMFRAAAGVPLARYVVSRKIAHAAVEILLSKKSLTEIAFEYGFESYDTFTRAFHREAGVNPSAYRDSGIVSGRRYLCEGVYGPFILSGRIGDGPLRMLTEAVVMKTNNQKESCILYGVPKVFYGREQDGGQQASPFPMCLQAVLSYMGQPVSYTELMAVTGMAFRLRWNPRGWDAAAVDIRNIYENHNRAFELGLRWAGRTCRILERETSSREEFIRLIRSELDEGRPLIGFGIVGPPEACVITGYSEGGEALHGWSLFQDRPEFEGEEVGRDESGYFICRDWWGEKTDAILAVGEQSGAHPPIHEALENALEVLDTGRIPSYEGRCGLYYGGQEAYSAWADALEDITQFTDTLSPEQLGERMMYMGDAMTMVGEGRSYAAHFFRHVVKRRFPELSEESDRCADGFQAVADVVPPMLALLDGNYGGNLSAVKLMQSAIREKLAGYTRLAGKREAEARERLSALLHKVKQQR